MGLLDQVIGGVVGQVLGGGRGGQSGGGTMSPIVKALLMLLAAKAASGGLGNIFGGEREAHPSAPQPYDPDAERGPSPYGRGPAEGDLGGFGQAPGGSGGEFGDLAGMLDGPGDPSPRSPGSGPYAHLDREPGQDSGALGGGLDGLIDSFERGGLGDVIGSWIGRGENRPVAPDRLADALGPDAVDTLSRQTGLDRNDLLAQLARALPQVVDALTPQGRPPTEQERRGW